MDPAVPPVASPLVYVQLNIHCDVGDSYSTFVIFYCMTSEIRITNRTFTITSSYFIVLLYDIENTYHLQC